jgi:Rrf2 family nitric oxide-sensitive transcriptional repressor
MLSQTAEYALRAVVYLAQHPGESCTVDSIARGTHVPVGYLAKIMQQLSRCGLTSSQRGLHGGFHLTRVASEITLFDPINAVDPFLRIRTCPMQIEHEGDDLCALHRTLDNTLAAVERTLKGTTVAQMLVQGTPPLCVHKPVVTTG